MTKDSSLFSCIFEEHCINISFHYCLPKRSIFLTETKKVLGNYLLLTSRLPGVARVGEGWGGERDMQKMKYPRQVLIRQVSNNAHVLIQKEVKPTQLQYKTLNPLITTIQVGIPIQKPTIKFLIQVRTHMPNFRSKS